MFVIKSFRESMLPYRATTIWLCLNPLPITPLMHPASQTKKSTDRLPWFITTA